MFRNPSSVDLQRNEILGSDENTGLSFESTGRRRGWGQNIRFMAHLGTKLGQFDHTFRLQFDFIALQFHRSGDTKHKGGKYTCMDTELVQFNQVVFVSQSCWGEDSETGSTCTGYKT